MRKCPVRGCGQSIADRMFVCVRHWKMFPTEAREHISGLFREYISERISLAEFRENTSRFLADFQGLAVEEIEESPVTAAVRRCDTCSRTCLIAVSMDGADVGRVVALEEREGGPLVVIGRRAEPATGHPAVYTRFAVHECRRPLDTAETSR